ncbi:hypothetical protein CFBP7900_31390 [Xanthomonas hortorum pv. carotae]|uniref:Uncharacterized protein n=1 Tax=Xanthomonas hortorum pv. carotae TaxID=487904 RepID=A0A6V7F961_9XANT|nr:hypothetical protein CFBP7900_31390 [Xanthomonas hortorum pv. carotae]CAD0359813.1 hypothetical protein CFBP7900_31390 [Xanthomonas hortorum pv. carotae]
MYHWRGRKFHCCVLFFGFAWVGFNVRSDRRNGALTFRHGCAGNNKITTLLRRMALRKRQKIAWARRHPDQLVRYRPRYCNLFAVIALVEYVGGLSTRRIAEVSIRGDCVCYHTQPTCSHCHDMPRQRGAARGSEVFRDVPAPPGSCCTSRCLQYAIACRAMSCARHRTWSAKNAHMLCTLRAWHGSAQSENF